MKTIRIATDVNKDIYDEAVNTLSRYNMDISKAMRIFIMAIAKKHKFPISLENDYITTPQEDDYDLECYNNAVKEWEKDGFKTSAFDELYKEFDIK